MPYIKADRRENLDRVHDLGYPATLGPGELNYAITQLVRSYVGSDVSYAKINEVVGVLECAKLELYRRLAAPYEDKKIVENGDVY